MSELNDNKVVKLMATATTSDPSATPSVPRKLLAGLLMLGFGAVFGVLGMFLYSRVPAVGVTLIALAGVSAVSGVMVVMKYGGDPRFASPPGPPHDDA